MLAVGNGLKDLSTISVYEHRHRSKNQAQALQPFYMSRLEYVLLEGLIMRVHRHPLIEVEGRRQEFVIDKVHAALPAGSETSSSYHLYHTCGLNYSQNRNKFL